MVTIIQSYEFSHTLHCIDCLQLIDSNYLKLTYLILNKDIKY
jgi:hypothetical protein